MNEIGLTAAASQQAAILVVEDDEEIQTMLRELLGSVGYKTDIVGAGETALAHLERETVDLVLLDLNLPDINGYDICARIREGNAASVPIIMLTANRKQQSLVRSLRLGADDYLMKPFAVDELLARIERQLQRRRVALSSVSENGALKSMLDLVQQELSEARTISSTEATLRHELLSNVATHLHSLVAVIEGEYRRTPPGAAREIVQRILGRVRGAALVYEISNSLQHDPARVDLIIHNTATALKHIYSPRKRIPLQLQGGPLELPVMYASAIATIVNEVVTNCFKHAFPHSRFGAITITYGVHKDHFELRVTDDGVGLPDEVSKNGRGIATVQELASNLGGTATWQSRPGGTEVTVHLPSPTTGTST